jgi:hypothetical protein
LPGPFSRRKSNGMGISLITLSCDYSKIHFRRPH